MFWIGILEATKACVKDFDLINLIRNAIKEEPEEDQAYALLGLVYKTRKDWVNSAFYYQNAILKVKQVPSLKFFCVCCT